MSAQGAAGLPLRFGLFLGQAGKDWPQVRDEFQEAEALGYDVAYLIDHLTPTEGPDDEPIHEAWTLLAGLALATSRIRIGVLVTSNTFRHPQVLLKQAVTVDHLSGGRLILGIGTGWFAAEHQRYGLKLPEPVERVDRFEEAVQLIDELMRAGVEGSRATFRGRHYRLDDAPLSPPPLQRPRIPLLIAAHRPRMLGIAARYADIWDTFQTMEGTATEGVDEALAGRLRRFEEAARAAGRDPLAIRRSTWAASGDVETAEGWLTFCRRHAAIGFTDLLAPLTPDPAARRTIAEELMPQMRAEHR